MQLQLQRSPCPCGALMVYLEPPAWLAVHVPFCSVQLVVPWCLLWLGFGVPCGDAHECLLREETKVPGPPWTWRVLGSLADVLSFLSDLPDVGFLLEGIFLSGWKYEEEKCYWQRIVFNLVLLLNILLSLSLYMFGYRRFVIFSMHAFPIWSFHQRVKIISTVWDIN